MSNPIIRNNTIYALDYLEHFNQTTSHSMVLIALDINTKQVELIPFNQFRSFGYLTSIRDHSAAITGEITLSQLLGQISSPVRHILNLDKLSTGNFRLFLSYDDISTSQIIQQIFIESDRQYFVNDRNEITCLQSCSDDFIWDSSYNMMRLATLTSNQQTTITIQPPSSHRINVTKPYGIDPIRSHLKLSDTEFLLAVNQATSVRVIARNATIEYIKFGDTGSSATHFTLSTGTEQFRQIVGYFRLSSSRVGFILHYIDTSSLSTRYSTRLQLVSIPVLTLSQHQYYISSGSLVVLLFLIGIKVMVSRSAQSGSDELYPKSISE